HDFNHLKHSGSLFKYFSKIIPEETEKEKHMKAKVTIKADVHNSQISSYSICTIFDNKNKELSKTTNVANSEYIHDDIDLIESEKSFIQPNKQKWSLKIQLQSSNIHVSDIMNIYTPLETLQLENSQHNSKNELCNSLWINKYKPNNSMEIVGNEEGVAKLKSWLKYWKLLKNNKEYSSSEEFYSSDCCVSNYVENNKVAVLIGPHGSGKTASVYAIANELGYKVLEINASSKRLGKQILKDFEEATKSHRVEKLHFNNIFTSLSKKKKNNNISQNSLILMEDVDLVFDEDQGFVTAMFQLVSSTKRPIVMTLTNNCFNLCKMAPQYLQINFTSVTGKKVLALLQLITLAETGCKLSINCLNALCQNGDLRKELLQLQYMLISDKEQIPFTSLAINNSFLKNIQIFIYKSAIKASKNIKMNHIFNDKSLNTVVLDKLVNYLDIFILISVLVNIDDPTSYLFELKSESSLSLIEHSEYYSNLDNISVEIGYWFNDTINKLISNDFKKTNSQIDINKYQLSVKKQINSRKSILSKIVSNTTDQQALAIDYLSNIRTICRAEEIRNQLNHKRGNRFYHYLQSSKLKIEKSSNILSIITTIL
ncbi:PREDICTED: ATPase family AAA domain-containing protein 5, partial [Ceratosolen solmsi marchali]|uniref:ATPase family AAA domain-containing protein 5 n=1 Tax=Ceratosolen solmsi marchali TaxID=326594 RepID=A0AAJ6YTE0_9HYME